MVASSGILLASGARAALRYARESVRNTTPAAIATPVTNIAAVASSSAGAGYSDFTRATGSFITDGFIKGQKVRTAGFATAADNADWIVHDVAALTLTVRDPNDVVVNESAATGQTVRILMKTLRGTSRAVNLEKNILETQEVDADSQETDSRHGFNRVVGAPGFQLSRKDYDDFIQFVMGREWDQGSTITTGPIGISVSVNTTTKIATFSRATGSFITNGFRPGDIATLTDPDTSDNDGDYRLLTVSALSVTAYDPDGILTASTAGGSEVLTLKGKRIDVGTEMQTFLLERAFQDVAQYQKFNGCACDQFSMNIEPESMINGTFNILGMSAAAISGTPLTSSVLSATSNAPYAAFDGQIFEGGAEIAVATSCNFQFQRNRSLNPIIGSKFSPDVFEGTARCTGTLTAYFSTASLLNKFINETESSVWFRFDDPNDPTQFLSIVFPRVKYNGGTMDPPQEGPCTIEMPFRALKATGLAAAGGTTRNTMMTIQVSNDLDN